TRSCRLPRGEKVLRPEAVHLTRFEATYPVGDELSHPGPTVVIFRCFCQDEHVATADQERLDGFGLPRARLPSNRQTIKPSARGDFESTDLQRGVGSFSPGALFAL